MTFTRHPPILIVGAGCSGLATALEMTRNGQAVRIIDKAPVPNTESRGTGLQARTLELLSLYGAADDIVRQGNPLRALSFFRHGRRVGAVDFSAGSSRFNFSPALPQALTEEVLRNRLAQAGVNVEWGVELLSLSQSERFVDVELRGPSGSTEAARSPWLVACDGARSPVRKFLDLPFDGMSYPEGWALMDATLQWDLPPDEVRIFHTDGPGQFVAVPLGGTRYRLQTDVRAAGMEGAPPTVAEMQVAFDGYTGRQGVISDPQWRSAFRIHRRQVVDYRKGRVLLAGDAAHIHTPAGAQGLNTGIQDGINLGWKLALVAQGYAGQALLDTYQEERKAIAAGVLGLAETLARNPSQMILDDKRPKSELADTVQQLAVNYRSGPLGQGSGSAGGPRLLGGDRVPDVTLGDQRLYGLLAQTRFVIVLAGADQAELDRAAASLRDKWGHVARVWLDSPAARPGIDGPPNLSTLSLGMGLAEGFAIIRPDAYFGLTGLATPEQAERRIDAYFEEQLRVLPQRVLEQ